MMTLREAVDCVPGAVLVGDGDVRFERVHSDTRTLHAGDLFVALRGQHFDGHDFLARAASAGAVGALAEGGLAAAALDGVQVKDSLLGLQALAAAWRRRWQGPMIAVTGSNGKTTVTQMIASILRAAHGECALATAGNFNNHIGVPLTLLRLRASHRIAVLELGMNHPGEIAMLAALVAPTVALVNNAQREHQEFMASVGAVAIENGAVIEALPATGIAVFPSDDAQALVWRQQAGRRDCITFALDAPADVTAPSHDLVDGGWRATLAVQGRRFELRLHMPGRHNLKNALAACAAALAAGLSPEHAAAGLEEFRPVKGRSQVLSLRLRGRDIMLVDDTYNANPDSVLAAIDVLAQMPAPQWLVLGDMGEVGDQGPAFHAEVGLRARERGIDHLWCAGTLSAQTARAYGRGARHFATVESLLEATGPAAAPDGLGDAASILVKGSRSMAMERVVAALRAAATAGDGGRP